MKRVVLTKQTRRSVGVWLRLIKCSRAMEGELSRRLHKHFKQSMARFDVLAQLERESDQWLAVGELSRRLLTANSNISRLLDRMADESLIQRRPSPDDRRSQQVTLTDTGRELFYAMAPAHATWVDGLVSELSSHEKSELESLLDKIRGMLSTRIDG